ncbi:glycosyltransferase [Evansella sp. AB-rgal1]|uniref:glycosyltransferase n=1 Tax=Evansella sp. AB-rgal1 TaxID=3242696 RepID=UPI00359E2413
MKEHKIAIIGQIAKWKGQDVFIKAAKLLHPKHPELKFLIVGDVLFDKKEELEYKKHLIQMAEGCHYIEFLGYQDNIPSFIQTIDILVHASIREEPFGRVIIEGMAAKKPVIASALGGPLEIIEDGVSGLLYGAGSDVELAIQIEKIISNEELYNNISKQGYYSFQVNFNLRKTISLVESCLDRLLVK